MSVVEATSPFTPRILPLQREWLLCLILAGSNACRADEMALPTPAPLRIHRESDDWIKAGRNIELKAGVGPGSTGRTFVVANEEAFPLTLVDDVWLWLGAPNAV